MQFLSFLFSLFVLSLFLSLLFPSFLAGTLINCSLRTKPPTEQWREREEEEKEKRVNCNYCYCWCTRCQQKERRRERGRGREKGWYRVRGRPFYWSDWLTGMRGRNERHKSQGTKRHIINEKKANRVINVPSPFFSLSAAGMMHSDKGSISTSRSGWESTTAREKVPPPAVASASPSTSLVVLF